MQVVLSPHVGDLDSLLAVEVFRRDDRRPGGFFQVAPEVVACDLHPDYASTRACRGVGRPMERAAACACSTITPTSPPAWPNIGSAGPVLGLAWDGTGYGGDGTIWGGEALRVPRRRVRPHRPSADLPLARRRSGHAPTAALGLGPALRNLRRCCRRAHADDRRRPGLLQPRRDEHAASRRWADRSILPAPAAWAGSSTAWRRCAGCRRSSASRGKRRWRWSSPPMESVSDAYPLPLAPGHARRGRLGAACPRPCWPIGRRACAVGRIGARFHNALAELALAVARRVGPAAGGPQRRLFSKRPVKRSRRPATGGGGLFRVHSTAGPARRRRHRLGTDLRRRKSVPSPEGRRDRINNRSLSPCALAFPEK